MTKQVCALGFTSVGQDVIIWPMAKIVSPEVISVGDSVIIDDFVFLMGGKSTVIGSFVHIASFTSITGGRRFCHGRFHYFVKWGTGFYRQRGLFWRVFNRFGSSVPLPCANSLLCIYQEARNCWSRGNYTAWGNDRRRNSRRSELARQKGLRAVDGLRWVARESNQVSSKGAHSRT